MARKTNLYRAYKVISNPSPGVVETLQITVEAVDRKTAWRHCEALGYIYEGNEAFMAVEEEYMTDLHRRFPNLTKEEHGELLAECFGG